MRRLDAFPRLSYMAEKKTRANGRASRAAILTAAADVFAENCVACHGPW